MTLRFEMFLLFLIVFCIGYKLQTISTGRNKGNGWLIKIALQCFTIFPTDTMLNSNVIF